MQCFNDNWMLLNAWLNFNTTSQQTHDFEFFLFSLSGSIWFKIRFTTCVLCACTLSSCIEKSRNNFDCSSRIEFVISRCSIVKRHFLYFDAVLFTFWNPSWNIKCLNLLLMLKILFICRLFVYFWFLLRWRIIIAIEINISVRTFQFTLFAVLVYTTAHTNGRNYQTKEERRENGT